MTDEAERILFETHAAVMALDAKLDALSEKHDELGKKLEKHVDDDEIAYADISSLKTFRTQLMTAAKVVAIAAPFIGSAFWWLASRVLAQ